MLKIEKFKCDILGDFQTLCLGEKLRVVANELIRAADILEGKTQDTIVIFNEHVGKMEKDTDNE